MAVVCEASSVSAVFVLLTYYTDALPGAKNIDRQISLHTPFTCVYPVPADFRAGVRVTFDWTRVHIVRPVFALLVFERCSLSWAHVVVDVITLMHVRFVWAALIVRHMGLSNSGPLGFGWLLCSGSAYYV